MTRIAAVTFVILSIGITRAEPPGLTAPVAEPGLAAPGLAVPELPAKRLARKNPRTAMLLSLGVTLAGPILFGAGLAQSNTTGDPTWLNVLGTAGVAAFVVGPSVGRIYAGRDGWNLGLKLRVGSLAPLALSLFTTALCAVAADGGGDSGTPGICYVALGSFVAGASMYVAGASYEIATSGRAVERYNRDAGLDARLSFAPIKTPDGGLAPGLALGGRF